MHVAPEDLRAVRQGDMTVRFTMLGAMAYVLAELPEAGSPGTSLEPPCEQPHWGFVIEGGLSIVTARQRLVVPAGRGFHVPAGGPEHHFETSGPALVAGFQPVETAVDVSDDALVAQGFEVLAGPSSATIIPAAPQRKVRAGQIRTEAWRMSTYLMTRTRMGERSGYTSGWCDAEHWGIVMSGRIAIEWEDDVEVLSTGDVFHCPAGPPGHRIEAADPATFLDLTPIDALEDGRRLVDWRRGSVTNARSRSGGIAVAALG